MTDTGIDFVITWVDGNDPIWREEKAKYSNDLDKYVIDARNNRYRAMPTFKYLFRGIEKFAPWVRKVFLVTYGHYPDWINDKNEKLVLVNHKDFIPECYLPTFNVAPVEFNLHRIAGLSQNFVYFNDDMFLIKSVSPEDFFKNGLPCDSAIHNAFAPSRIKGETKVYFKSMMDTAIINEYFAKKTSMIAKPSNWFNFKYGIHLFRTLALLPWRHFTGFENWHLPYSLNKSTFEEIWIREEEYLSEICSHRFRQGMDPNIWLFSYWQYASNSFFPRNPKIGSHFSFKSDFEYNKNVLHKYVKKSTKMICINDEFKRDDEFLLAEKQISSFFENILPDKCSFEK